MKKIVRCYLQRLFLNNVTDDLNQWLTVTHVENKYSAEKDDNV